MICGEVMNDEPTMYWVEMLYLADWLPSLTERLYKGWKVSLIINTAYHIYKFFLLYAILKEVYHLKNHTQLTVISNRRWGYFNF